MKFFIDTANLDEIREANALGVLDGVTTNPSLASKEGMPFHELILEICRIVDGPVSAEVVSVEADAMVAEARELAKLHDNIYVKIPLLAEGLKAVKRLTAENIRTNVTLVFTPTQALLAAKAGASIISPFVGRLDDLSQDGLEVARQIRIIYDNYGFKTELLVASVRHPLHVLESALMGADICTMPLKVINQLIHHPMTDIGLKKFLDDWNKVKA